MMLKRMKSHSKKPRVSSSMLINIPVMSSLRYDLNEASIIDLFDEDNGCWGKLTYKCTNNSGSSKFTFLNVLSNEICKPITATVNKWCLAIHEGVNKFQFLSKRNSVKWSCINY